MRVTCYCGSPARLRTSKYGPFWSCSRWPDCDGTVGCHPGTEMPLGTLADQATRTARRKAHEAFDPLWRSVPVLSRDDAYRWLGEMLEIDDPHMGEMDRETAERVVEVCEAALPEEIEEWLDR